MSRTKEWLMDQIQADVDVLGARITQLEAGIAELLAALEMVDEDFFLGGHAQEVVTAAIEHGKAVRS
jgi:hypothetical protein